MISPEEGKIEIHAALVKQDVVPLLRCLPSWQPPPAQNTGRGDRKQFLTDGSDASLTTDLNAALLRQVAPGADYACEVGTSVTGNPPNLSYR